MSERATAGEAEGGAGTEGDRWLLMVALGLVAFGVVMVLSSSQAYAVVHRQGSFYYFLRQAGFAGLGLVALVVLSRTDYHRLRRFAPALAAVVACLMILVLVPGIGIRVNGARRWLSLGPLGSFQPSEIGKLAFVLFIAHWIDKRGDRLGSFGNGFVPFAILLTAVLSVLMLQKDLGTALVTTALFVSIYFAGGGRKRYLVLLVTVLVAAFVLVTVLESYRAQRLAVWLDPLRDPLGTGFQSQQGLLALGSGGLTGVGLGHSIQKYLWLPEAHTDFIFGIIGEETGLLGTTLVLAAFVLLAVRGYRAAMRAPDRYGVMVGVGITTWVAFQALINMGTVTDTLPITGVPLPFISYGGTSLAITMAAVGVLLNVAGQGERRAYSRRRMDATLDSRRGDRRPPVAGTRRRAGVPR